LRIGYARVSTDDQSLDLQLDALHAARCDHIFEDRQSGKSRNRPGLEQALSKVGAGDQIVVYRLDRMGRNFRHLVDIADELRERGADLVSLSEGIDTSSSVGEVVFRLFSVFSDFERKVIVERTVAGLAAARSRGVKFGRRPVVTDQMMTKARQRIEAGDKMSAVAAELGVGRSTLFRHLRRRDTPVG